jgi:PAS domain S-box-containing protein
MYTPDLSTSLATALLEAAADGVLVTDEQGTIVLASASAASMLGWTRDELVGTDIARILTAAPVGKPSPWRVEGRRILTGRRRDGTELFLEVTTSSVEAPQGRLSLAVLRDATDRRHEVEALERSEAWLRQLIDQAPDGILVVGHDGRYEEANESMCRLLGYSRDELVGKQPLDISAPEDVLRLVETRARLSESGGALELVRWTFVHKDGTRVPTEINARILADGRRQAFVRDIRPRERVEQELRVAEAERAAALRELEVALEQCPAGITILRGRDGRHITLNRAARAIWGDRFAPKQGLQQPTGILCRPDGTPLPREEFPAARAVRGEHLEHERHAVRLTNGTLVPYEINAAPLFDEHGAVAGAVVIAWDVSTLIELERLRTEWSSLVAHDLRQPIHGISGFAQLARRHARSKPELVQRDIAQVLALTARLTRMTDDLLDFSRLEANRLTIEWTTVDLVACVGSAVDRLALEEPELRVEMSLGGEIPKIEGDPQRLAQVMDNLLSNARKYRRSGSLVRVHIEREGERVAVAVTNEGDGIEPEDMHRLFQRFERLGAARTRIAGIGLGLQITRGLVEAHGGTIAAQSVPGGETTFRFTLPLVRAVDDGHERDSKAPG